MLFSRPYCPRREERCCCPVCQTSLVFHKVDMESGVGLPCARFELSCNGEVIAVRESARNGLVVFPCLSPGVYCLREVVAPPCYIRNEEPFMVIVDENCNVSLNGIQASRFVIRNSMVTAASFVPINFTKADGNSFPLAGAVFSLTAVSDGAVAGISISDLEGVVNFHVLPGSYELREIMPPRGYRINAAVYTIVANPDGTVTVDGEPIDNFGVINLPL